MHSTGCKEYVSLPAHARKHEHLRRSKESIIKYGQFEKRVEMMKALRALYRSTSRAGPRILLTEGLHPQREAAAAAVGTGDPIPAVAAERARVPVQEEAAAAARVQGIGPGHQTIQRHALAAPPEVSEDQGRVLGHRAEGREVGRRELVLLTEFTEEVHLLLHGLIGAPGHEARNPERDAFGGRRVGEVPVLEVPEVLVAGTGLRRSALQRETRPHAPVDGAAVLAHVHRELAAALGSRADAIRQVLVIHRSRQELPLLLASEGFHELLDLPSVRRVNEKGGKILADLTLQVCHTFDRNGHCFLLASQRETAPCHRGKEEAGGCSQPSL